MEKRRFKEENDTPSRSYPTDAKEREKEQRTLDKEKGIERPVRKKRKICEYHHYDRRFDVSR